jgi:hypothetical protein
MILENVVNTFLLNGYVYENSVITKESVLISVSIHNYYYEAVTFQQ